MSALSVRFGAPVKKRVPLLWALVLLSGLLGVACGRHTTYTTDGGCLGVTVPDEGRCHEAYGTPIAYQNDPPASGCHWPCWAPYGVSSVVLDPEVWVHNLEHGAVVLLYRCADAVSCPDAGAQLAAIQAQAPDAPTGGHRVLVTADPTLPAPFAAVAWDHVLLANQVSAPEFLCFIQTYEGQGPEDNPSDGFATCQ